MMNFGGKLGAVAIASAFLISNAVAAANVAQLGDITGKVLVNQGKGYVAAAGMMSLKAGDQLMIGKDASATISFKDCQISLSKPTVFTVGAAPCAKGAKTAQAGQVLVTPTADAPAGLPAGAAMGSGAAGLVGAGPLLLVGGGIAAAGILILANNSSSASAP